MQEINYLKIQIHKELYNINIIMPTGKNWLNLIYVHLIFIIQIMAIYYFISLKENQPKKIKKVKIKNKNN